MSEDTVYERLIHSPPKAVTWCESTALSSSGSEYSARVECRYPDDPIAIELCKRLARQRADYLASIR